MATTTADRIGKRLEQMQTERIVFAESCTGGLAAALITQVPGISNYFCGSAVTYRENTKIAWLRISAKTLEAFTAQSQQTTDAMALAVLEKTPEATIAAAITGHLGPGAEASVDGRVFISIAATYGRQMAHVDSLSLRLKSSTRVERQHEAAELMLRQLEKFLADE